MTATGKCLCGAVRFTVTAVETHHHVCHCGTCRRWAGGPVFAAAADGVSFEGAESLVRYRSSEWARRGFCKVCGSNLFYYLEPTGQYMMCVGAFDDSTPFKVVREIFIDHQPPGYALAGTLERETEAQVLAKFSQ
jgi:hypothetical protein